MFQGFISTQTRTGRQGRKHNNPLRHCNGSGQCTACAYVILAAGMLTRTGRQAAQVGQLSHMTQVGLGAALLFVVLQVLAAERHCQALLNTMGGSLPPARPPTHINTHTHTTVPLMLRHLLS